MPRARRDEPSPTRIAGRVHSNVLGERKIGAQAGETMRGCQENILPQRSVVPWPASFASGNTGSSQTVTLGRHQPRPECPTWARSGDLAPLRRNLGKPPITDVQTASRSRLKDPGPLVRSRFAKTIGRTVIETRAITASHATVVVCNPASCSNGSRHGHTRGGRSEETVGASVWIVRPTFRRAL